MELAGEKTRLIEFGRFAAERRRARGLPKPETFEFLGFAHICAVAENGRFKLKRVTSKKRMRAKLRAVKTELMHRRHLPIPERAHGLGAWCEGTAPTTPCPITTRRSVASGPGSCVTGGPRCGAAASAPA